MNANSCHPFPHAASAFLAVLALLLLLGCAPPPDESGNDESGNDESSEGEAGRTGEPEQAGPEGGLLQEIVNARAEALRLQQTQDLKGAKAAWQQVLQLVQSDKVKPAKFAVFRDEAQHNLDIIEELEVLEPAPDGETTLSTAQVRKEEAISPSDALRYYRVGRKTRGTAITRITGRGVNKKWLKTECGFVHFFHVTVETEVLENHQGKRIVFRQRFPEVRQELVTWDVAKVSLRDIGPIPRAAFAAVEELVLKQIPLYIRLKQAAQAYEGVIDPGFEKLLTRLVKTLKEMGMPPADIEQAEVLVRLEKLQGSEFEFTYDTDFGVTKINASGPAAENFSADQLERLALGSSLLMDYYIFPAAKKAVGDRWKVRADQVSGMLNLYDVTVGGEIGLERCPDENLDGREMVGLAVTGGSVSGRTRERTMTVRPESGLVYCVTPSTDETTLPMIKEARLEWHAADMWASRDHLLFGTERVTDLQMSTRYLAEPVPADGE